MFIHGAIFYAVLAGFDALNARHIDTALFLCYYISDENTYRHISGETVKMLVTWKFYDWDIYADEGDYNLETGERVTLPIQIGEEVEADAKTPVIEYIYSDILDGGLKGLYSVTVNAGRIPCVIFKYGGEVIDHNENMPIFREEIEKALEEVPLSLRLKAIISAAPTDRNASIPKTSALADVTALVCAQTETKYNQSLVHAVLKESISSNKIFASELKDRLSQLKRGELLELIADIKANKLKNDYVSKGILAELLTEFTLEDISREAAWEVTDREFFKGHL